MKIFRPLQGAVLFTYPAISINDYRWSLRPVWQKWLISVISVSFIAVFLIVLEGNVLMRLGILQWLEILTILVGGVGAFYLISRHPGIPRNFSHYFYTHSARVYTGIGKGGTVILFPDCIGEIHLSEATFKSDHFHLFTVTFKPIIPHLIPDFRKITFGIPVDADLDPLRDWARDNGLEILQNA